MKNLLMIPVVCCISFFAYAETEPNNSAAQANSLSLNGSDIGSLDSNDVADWWKVVVTSDGKLVINTSSAASLELDLYLYDVDSVTQLVYGGLSGVSESVTFNNLMPGTYFIKVSFWSGVGNYTINSTFTATAYTNDTENNDSVQVALSHALNGSSTGHLGFYSGGYTDPRDWYKITIPSDGKLVVKSVSDATLEMDLALYDIDSITQISYLSLSGVDDSVKHNNLLAGTYFVRALKWSGYGSYTISNQFTASSLTNDTENNDSVQVSLTLALDGSSTGHLGYYAGGYTDPRDWYKITIPSDGKLVVKSVSDATLEMDLALYDIDSTTQISYLSLSGVEDSVKHNNLLPGTYFVRALKWTGYGSYTINNSFTPAGFTNDTENNDSVEVAINLQANGNSTGHLGFYSGGYTDPRDWYKITLPADGKLVVNSLSDASLELDLAIYDMNGTSQIAYLSISGAADSVKHNYLKAGTYFVRALKWTGYGSYTISNFFTPAGLTNDSENNDSVEVAINLSVNGNSTGHLGFYSGGYTDPRDWYKITLPADGKLVVNSQSDASLEIDLAIYDMNGTSQIAYLSISGVADSVKHNYLKAGTYFVRALKWSGYGSYTISNQFTAADLPNDLTTNDLKTQPQVLNVNSSETGHLGYYGNLTTDVDDWWKITVSSSGNLVVNTLSNYGLCNVSYLYDGDTATVLVNTWSPPCWDTSRTMTYNGITPGEYFVKCNRYSGYGSYTISATLYSAPAITAQPENDTICEGSNSSFSVTASGNPLSYQWQEDKGSGFSNLANGGKYSGATTNILSITGADIAMNGYKYRCVINDTIALTPTATSAQAVLVANPLPVANAGSDVSICTGTGTTLNATGNGTFSWSPSTGLSCTSCASPDATPASTTTYTVTVTNSCGTATSDVTVTISTTPTVNAGADTAICKGSAVTLNASGSGTFSWSPPAGLSCTTCASPSANPNVTTKYTLTITTSCGTAMDEVNVTVNDLPVVTATPSDTTVCAGTIISLSGGGTASYSWSGGITDGIGFSANSSQTYTVTGTDANGCTATATATVNVNPLPTVIANATATTVCAGTAVTLTGGGAVSYDWSDGVTNGVSFTPASTKTYLVTGTDANSCKNTADVTVTVNPLPVVSANATDTVVCSGTQVILSGSGASTYSWTGGITDGVSFIPTSTLTYTVTGTDVNGCKNTDDITVTVNVCTGLPVTKQSVTLNVFPNPFKEYVTIQFNQVMSTAVISVFDRLGREVKNQSAENTDIVIIARTDLSPGLYFMKIYSNEEILGVVKLMVE